MNIKPPIGNRLQGAVAARHRACRRTFVLQMPGNAADAVPCERFLKILSLTSQFRQAIDRIRLFATRVFLSGLQVH